MNFRNWTPMFVHTFKANITILIKRFYHHQRFYFEYLTLNKFVNICIANLIIHELKVYLEKVDITETKISSYFINVIRF